MPLDPHEFETGFIISPHPSWWYPHDPAIPFGFIRKYAKPSMVSLFFLVKKKHLQKANLLTVHEKNESLGESQNRTSFVVDRPISFILCEWIPTSPDAPWCWNIYLQNWPFGWFLGPRVGIIFHTWSMWSIWLYDRLRWPLGRDPISLVCEILQHARYCIPRSPSLAKIVLPIFWVASDNFCVCYPTSMGRYIQL